MKGEPRGERGGRDRGLEKYEWVWEETISARPQMTCARSVGFTHGKRLVVEPGVDKTEGSDPQCKQETEAQRKGYLSGITAVIGYRISPPGHTGQGERTPKAPEDQLKAGR